MKIRKGFVSNSSSSSFVVAIKDLPDVELFKKMIGRHNDLAETYLYFGKKYVMGKIDINCADEIEEYLTNNKIDFEEIS